MHIFSFLFVRLYLNDILFFDYQGLSLQAVLFLVPKNVLKVASLTILTKALVAYSS